MVFGGNLIALNKKGSGIRPITIDYVFRRIAANCANSFAIERISQVLCPIQAGVGTKGGVEAAVHATRRYLKDIRFSSDHVVVKLDFRNAFNSLRRDCMLAAVVKYVPEIFAFCSKSYTCQPTSMFNEHSIISATGTQQGDPLGALLFCITLQPVLEQVTSELNIGYLDDITLGGIAADVGRDVEMIRVEAGRLGLKLNDAKCELINNGFNECSHQAFSGFIRIDS